MSELKIDDETPTPFENKTTAQIIRERRLERMRLGTNTCEIVQLFSDPEIRVALVPLVEREYDEAMRAVAALAASVPENIPGGNVMDREEHRQVLVRALREPDDLKKKLFTNMSDLNEVLEPEDINHLYEEYVAMVLSISPHVAQLTEEQVDFLKAFWQNLQWKDLSGKQLYVLSRFISTLSQTQLMGNSPGSFLTNS